MSSYKQGPKWVHHGVSITRAPALRCAYPVGKGFRLERLGYVGVCRFSCAANSVNISLQHVTKASSRKFNFSLRRFCNRPKACWKCVFLSVCLHSSGKHVNHVRGLHRDDMGLLFKSYSASFDHGSFHSTSHTSTRDPEQGTIGFTSKTAGFHHSVLRGSWDLVTTHSSAYNPT